MLISCSISCSHLEYGPNMSIEYESWPNYNLLVAFYSDWDWRQSESESMGEDCQWVISQFNCYWHSSLPQFINLNCSYCSYKLQLFIVTMCHNNWVAICNKLAQIHKMFWPLSNLTPKVYKVTWYLAQSSKRFSQAANGSSDWSHSGQHSLL